MGIHICDLPNELLSEIFIRLDPSYIITVRKVCGLWKVVADETVGIELCVGRCSRFLSTHDDYWHPLEALQTRSIAKCCINISDNSPLGHVEDEEALQQEGYPVFGLPYLVNNLTMYGDISRKYFARLVSPLLNLTELDLHISALSSLTKNKKELDDDASPLPVNLLNAWISRRKLRTLRVSMTGFEIWHLRTYRGDSLKLARCLENLYDILDGYYPHMQRLEMEFPFMWEKDVDITKALARFLHRHYKSLRHISLEFRFYWTLEEKPFAEPSDEYMRAYADQLPQLAKIINLKHFNFEITSKRLIVPSLFFWEKILHQQESLEYLKFKSGYHCTLPERLIFINRYTLKVICLTVMANSLSPVDCKMLGKCERLERLELDARLVWVNHTWETTCRSQLVNVDSLPETLKIVRLCSIPIGANEVDHICLGLKMLESLHLEDIGGQTDELGLRFPTLCEMYSRKQLKSFRVIAGFNESSLYAAKKEWRTFSPSQSLLLRLAILNELPMMVKREDDGTYIADLGGVVA